MILTWQDFENTCSNVKDVFEDLCRIFFKYRYAKDVAVILNQKANNPGIETEPILIDGKNVGFQAKYFSVNISYEDILDSAQKVVKYYAGKIDKVVLFCNKDISTEAENYKKAVELLSEKNITIELCCNKNILDIINIDDKYVPIKALFFNKVTLTDKWFKEKLDHSLQELEPRYRPGLHVNEFESQKHFDILYRNEQVIVYLQTIIDEARKELKHNNQKILVQKVETVIDSLQIPSRHDLEKVLFWYEKFSAIKNEIELAKQSLESKIEAFYDREINLTDEELRKIYDELRPYKQLSDIIQSFDLMTDEHFKYINNNVLIVEGDAGKGKSHLLGYEAEYHGITEKYRSVLLLGQKFIFDKSPQEQIMQILGLQVSFHEFLLACEAKGELDGGITVIMIDAVNECQKYSIWKQYLNEIIEQIKNLRNVRLVCSIRTTYKKHIFSNSILKEIDNGTISLCGVMGFRNNLTEAVPLFFNYYKIPITTAAFFNLEFENPLFLHTYCEAYSEGIGIGSRGIFALYNAYIEKEEEKVRTIFDITDDFRYAKKIIGVIGKYLYTNNTNYILLDDLYEGCKNFHDCDKFIDAFLKAKVLVQYNIEEKEHVYVSYERFSDYIVAKHILESTKNFTELCTWVENELLKTDNHGYFVRNSVEGQFAALSLLAREQYNKEIIDCLNVLLATDKFYWYKYSEIVTEYLDSYIYRADKNINADDFYKIVVPHIRSNETEEKFFDVLIGLAGRNCELNIESTTKFLMQMSLKNRDYHWTLYINGKYTQGERVYNIVQYFLTADLRNITPQDRLLYGQLLTWFLSSSNRVLRDKSSRALIRLLKNDIGAMTKLLKEFASVNDPYIISRLFGCIYGALIQTSEKNLNKDDLSILCKKIFISIFDAEIVYTDILLRDYALNIIEFCVTKHVKLDFEISKCRPPYKSFEIPTVDIKELEKLYPKDGHKGWLGTSAIKLSMAPDYNMNGFTGQYGDFGRYTFQSALREFKNVNIQQAFFYAYSYIINNLGYDNKLFSENDRHIGYGRGRNNCHIERIGKKYEWITMYHVLALVSDLYDFDDKYYDTAITYKGTWLPYVRDFDPTLTITTDDHPHKNLGVAINRKKYGNWQLSNDDWTKIDDTKDFLDQVRMIDNNGETWYALFFTASDSSGNDFNKSRQSVWLSSTACLIKKSECQNFISKIKDKSLYGRWFSPAEVESRYNVFAREYVWSPAYIDGYGNNGFIEAEIEVGKKKVRKTMPVLKYGTQKIDDTTDIDLEEVDSLEIEMTTEDVEDEEPICEVIGSLMPCCHFYLWEEEYDYSKDDVIHISMPNGYIVNALKLEQVFDGVWQRNGEIVCADFKLIAGSNVDGLYIKEKYLRELLADEFSIVWIGMGEKQHTYGLSGSGKQSWNELSSLIYEDKSGQLKEIYISKPCGSNVKQ